MQDEKTYLIARALDHERRRLRPEGVADHATPGGGRRPILRLVFSTTGHVGMIEGREAPRHWVFVSSPPRGPSTQKNRASKKSPGVPKIKISLFLRPRFLSSIALRMRCLPSLSILFYLFYVFITNTARLRWFCWRTTDAGDFSAPPRALSLLFYRSYFSWRALTVTFILAVLV